MRLLVLAFLTVALAGPREAESCGPFLPMAQFTYVSQPPQGVFAHGQLGILLPSYHRRYLVIAYRYLTGVPLTKEEVAEFDLQPAVDADKASPLPPTPVEQWLAARKQVPGLPAPKTLSLDRLGQPPNQFESYQNCLDDAFVNASRTLGERIQRWGASNPLVAEWLRGQNAVFEKCSGGPAMPQPLTGNADPLLAADRRYQIAAAEFYSGQYEDAERDFGAIAADAESPWHDLGKLLVARTQIREGTVHENPSRLQAASETLRALLQDSQYTKWHRAAQGLRDFVEARINPQGRLLELAEKLSHPASGPEFSDALADFTKVWDKENHGPAAMSDLADWITTFAGRNWSHALERWRAQPDDAWLVASLLWVPYDNAAIPDLLAAAHRVDPAAPAWPTVTFYGISRAIARGDIEAARSWADSALAIQQTPDVHNVFLAQRLKLSRGWDDFLRFTPRTPVALNYDAIDSDSPVQDGGQVVSQKTAAFDMDFTAPFNVEVPLGRWVDAASTVDLPAALRADIAQAGWVRAVVLHRPTEAQALAQRLAELRPQLRAPMQSWLAEKDADAARFKAVLLMMRTPGLQPEVRPGFGRLTADGQIDDFRDNWWTLSEPKASEGNPAAPPDFLPEPERATGRKEWQQLLSTAAQATDYLSSETIAWARLHRDDPRVPEALHLAVRTSRYTSNATPTRFPKQAFQLLHSWYPKSTWAAQTPYWY
jgi:tetratricopeptide (TPR) repeat protein